MYSSKPFKYNSLFENSSFNGFVFIHCDQENKNARWITLLRNIPAHLPKQLFLL